MPHKCKKCLRELRPWSKFKDLKSKEGLGLAICGSIINGVDHFGLVNRALINKKQILGH